MKIAIISLFDPEDIRQWSGALYYITRELKRQGQELSYSKNLKQRLPFHIKCLYWLYSRVLKRPLNFEREKMVLAAYGKLISKDLERMSPDVILSIGVSYIVTDIKTKIPIAVWSDATFSGLKNFYPEFNYLSGRAIRNGHLAEQKALDMASLTVMSSDWAVGSAVSDYHADTRKLKVIPFGANISTHHSRETISAYLAHKKGRPCKLLFVGVHWVRKGAGKALEILVELNQRNFECELYIVGCTPPADVQLPENVKNIPFINKNTPEGMKQIEKLFEEAHFFLLPTIADCTPIVFCEANAYGLPVLTHQVGGIPTVIQDGVNGQCFDLEAPVSAWADYICDTYNSGAYEDLCHSSFNYYLSALNWEVNVKKLISELGRLNNI